MCYICGKQFGKSSLPIHEKACIKKWHDRENKKPKKERRKLPVKTQSLQGQGNMTVDQYNELAGQAYNKNLIQCEYCGRTFRDEAMKHHRNACGPNSRNGKHGGSKRLGAATNAREYTQAEEETMNSARVPCPTCNRKFSPDSIARHTKICAKNKHKPTAPPTTVDESYTDKFGVRRGGRGGLATSNTHSTTTTTTSHAKKSVRHRAGQGHAADAAAPLVLSSEPDSLDTLTHSAGAAVARPPPSTFKMLEAAVDQLMELGASPQEVQNAVMHSLQKWTGQ